MSNTGKYAHLLDEIEAELKSAKEEKVKTSLKALILELEGLDEKKAELESEIKQLLKDGKITKLDSYIKIQAGVQDDSAAAPLVIEKTQPAAEAKTTGVHVSCQDNK